MFYWHVYVSKLLEELKFTEEASDRNSVNFSNYNMLWLGQEVFFFPPTN